MKSGNIFKAVLFQSRCIAYGPCAQTCSRLLCRPYPILAANQRTEPQYYPQPFSSPFKELALIQGPNVRLNQRKGGKPLDPLQSIAQSTFSNLARTLYPNYFDQNLSPQIPPVHQPSHPRGNQYSKSYLSKEHRRHSERTREIPTCSRRAGHGLPCSLTEKGG